MLPDAYTSALMEWTDKSIRLLPGNSRDARLEALYWDYAGWCKENRPLLDTCVLGFQMLCCSF